MAKLDAQGALLWMRRAGGSGFDLGLKLALGPGGALAVTGTFSGTADLFGTTATSNGGTTDFFVALLNADDGTAQWVRTGGSAAFTDTPGAVSVAPNGNVTVAGKFKGTAVFDAGSLTSPIDPWTQEHGFDVFIASYSGNGAALWLQHGSGSHDEEAVELVTDEQSNIYVTGQYSDTITFDISHPNIALNSIYVVKFDAAGQELWFRKCGGTILNRVSDMRVGSDGGLLLCGDVEGQMQWIDQVPVVVPSAYDRAYFLLRVSSDGTLVNSTTMGSLNEVRSASITEQADSVVVYGDFRCDFTGLQAAYGADGLFMATGIHDFFISKHAKSDLAFLKAQQFGGGGEKRAGQVETTPDNGLVFCGSYDLAINIPANDYLMNDVESWNWCGVLSSNVGLTYCGDAQYGTFATIFSSGLMDGFVGRCLVESRQPYDFWDRHGQAPCDRSNLAASICIRPVDVPTCVDSVSACTEVDLLAMVHLPVQDDFCQNSPTVAPAMYANFWESPFLGSTQMTAYWTGWYHYGVSVSNGCWSVMDTIHVEIIPQPEAHFTSSDSTYIDHPYSGSCSSLSSCDTLWLWTSSIQAGETFTWTDARNVVTTGDSVYADTSGVYQLTVIGPNGCVTVHEICFELIETYIPPNVTDIRFTYFFEGDTLDIQDTAYTCGGCISGFSTLTWFIDGVEAPPPAGIEMFQTTMPGCIMDGHTTAPAMIPWDVYAPVSGWYTFENAVAFNNEPCGDDQFSFGGLDSIFIVRNDGPPMTITPGIPACVGDTATLTVQCPTCDSLVWTPNPGILTILEPGNAIEVNAFGYYQVTGYSIEPGITCPRTINTSVYQAPLPNIYINPSNGVICPNDSALVYTTGWALGTGYQWQGPGGVITTNNDTLAVTEPGDYYLTVTTITGCPVSNGPVTLTEFSSPFIQALPSNLLCAGGTVVLEVVAGPGALLSWQAPLFGSLNQQTVTQPGTYTCIVTSCGVQWVLPITVIGSGISADVGPGPFLLCDGPILLSGPDSAAQYLWIPDNVFTQDLLVDVPGEHQLIVFDGNGCSDTSAVIQVGTGAFTSPIVVEDISICGGQVATLEVSGSGTFTWFADAVAEDPLAAGATVQLGPFNTSDTVYVVQAEGGCVGAPMPVTIVVLPGSSSPIIIGDTMLCSGGTLMLAVDPQPGTSYEWTTPIGAIDGPVATYLDISAAQAGPYTIIAYGPNGCPPSMSHVQVTVSTTPGTPAISGNTAICEGSTLVLNASSTPGTAISWTTPQGTVSGSPLVVDSAIPADGGSYSVVIIDAGCAGAPATVLVVIAEPITASGIEGNTVLCAGSPLELSVIGAGGAVVDWFPPVGPVISMDTLLIPSTTVAMSGIYVSIVQADPCPDIQQSVNVVIEDCDITIPNVFTPNGDGDNDELLVRGPANTVLSMRIFNRWGQMVAELGGQVLRWTGRDTATGERAPDGVYYYVIELPAKAGGGVRTGYVQLVGGR